MKLLEFEKEEGEKLNDLKMVNMELRGRVEGLEREKGMFEGRITEMKMKN